MKIKDQAGTFGLATDIGGRNRAERTVEAAGRSADGDWMLQLSDATRRRTAECSFFGSKNKRIEALLMQDQLSKFNRCAMSSSACQLISTRTWIFSSMVVLCLLALFLTNYNLDIMFHSFDNMYDGNQHCPLLSRLLSADGDKESSSNRSTELHINPHQNDTQEIQEIQEIQKTQAAAVDTEQDTIVLIWMWPFGSKYDLSCSIFNITKCHLTDDKTLYQKAHGVLFHHLDINRDLANMPKEPRPSSQKWIWSNMESPANSATIPGLNQLFNLTCNYRLDSDIPVPYGYLVPVTPEDETFKLPAKDKLVCWIVSNWSWRYKRVQFYNELQKHIEIHVYGSAFGQQLSHEDYPKIMSSCKFYLSFENSIYRDYITEKLYKPMNLGSVPIVLGPTRQNYEDHVPGDSFIHVNDFSTPKELAKRLLYLDENTSEYMKYFDWRNRFKVALSYFGRYHACQTCRYLQKHKGYQAILNLNEWYWC